MLDKTAKPRRGITIVLMPDFVFDHILSYDGQIDSLLATFRRMADRGGGLLTGLTHKLMRGGNAANAASALATLGTRAVLLGKMDRLGLVLLAQLNGKIDASHVLSDGKMAVTLALEARHGRRLVNLMVNDPGSIEHFGYHQLTKRDRELLRKADFVCVLNWALNKNGTELARSVFTLVKRTGVGRTFFDPSDPSGRIKKLPQLVRRVLRGGLADIISLNESEALQLASSLDPSFSYNRNRSDQIEEAGFLLHEKFHSRIDLHTTQFSATYINEDCYRIPCVRVSPVISTGSGDAWNAADIYADAIGLDPEERLLFANVAAGLYVANGEHTDLAAIRRFLRSASMERKLGLEC